MNDQGRMTNLCPRGLAVAGIVHWSSQDILLAFPGICLHDDYMQFVEQVRLTSAEVEELQKVLARKNGKLTWPPRRTNVPVRQLNREAGANPARPRHCNRGRKPQMVTVPLLRIGKTAVSRTIRKSGYLKMARAIALLRGKAQGYGCAIGCPFPRWNGRFLWSNRPWLDKCCYCDTLRSGRSIRGGTWGAPICRLRRMQDEASRVLPRGWVAGVW
jgi:hypothetical protein